MTFTMSHWLHRVTLCFIIASPYSHIYFPTPAVHSALVFLLSRCCRLNYLVAGGLHPVGFHVLNIILHAVISALMIDVFAVLIGGLAYDEKGRILNHAPKTSLLAAIFFAAHPVHTESVSRVDA